MLTGRRLKFIGLQSLEDRLRGDLIETYKIITGKEKVLQFNEVKHDLRGHKFNCC
jgi:hypothetical protein